MQPVSATAYWWNEVPNFGDALTPLLLRHFSNIAATRETVGRAEIVAVGSVLEHIPPEYDGHIIGAGKLYADSRLHLHTDTATILALRGPHSASGVKGDYVLGDPGLLADQLVSVEARIHPLGILPHWSDSELAGRFADMHPLIIDPSWDPLRVISAIGSCQKLVTSSLHGMIVADSWGIPRRFEAPPVVDYGGFYKHQDYSASIGAPFAIGETTRVSKFSVEDRRNDLLDAFEELGRQKGALR